MMLLYGGLFAQPHIQLVHDATDVDFIQHSVVEFAPGLYVVAGTVTPGPLTGNSDILVLMVDNVGHLLWSRYVDYGQDEFVGSLMVGMAGQIVLTGYTGTNNTPNKWLVVVKLDGLGNHVGDVVISDSGPFGYGLYGLDIEQTNAGDYMVVGTGVQNATLPAPKYGFVLQLDFNLNNINWGRIYQSPSTTSFDSFNHILKVTNFPTTPTERYLLTGTGSDPSGSQMAINDLIRANGNSTWAFPRGYNAGAYSRKGVMALYRDVGTIPQFYVLYPGVRTQPSVLVLNGNTGSIMSNWEMTNAQNNLLNGMVWENPAVQDNIVFSGYVIDVPTIPPTPPLVGRPVLFSVGVSGPSLQWSRSYTPVFNPAAFQSIPFDYIVQPLHSVSGYLNQYFYQPKTLIHDMNGFQFAAPMENIPIGTFDLRFLNTDSTGNVNPNCMGSGGFTFFQYTPPPDNVAANPYVFAITGSGANVVSANVNNTITCALPPQPKPSMGNSGVMGDMEIQVYPNPVKNILQVSGLSGMENAKTVLYDLKGRIVLSQNVLNPTNTQQLDVSTLESGVYFVKVSEGGEVVFVEKMAKK